MNAPVAQVTVLEDRAHVRRRGRASVAAGPSRLVVEGVSPFAVDKTLSARLGDVPVQLVDVQIVRRIRDHGELEDPPELRARRRALESEVRSLRRTRMRAGLHLARLTQLTTRVLADSARDAAWGEAPPPPLDGELRSLGAERRALARQVAELKITVAEREADLARLGYREVVERRVEDDVATSIVLTVLASEAAEFDLEIDYVVAGACWRPWHRAELDEAAGTVAFATDACVWQRTGESWEGVTLLLSTERASLGAAAPTLETDLLRVQPKREQLVVEARDRSIEVAGLGTGSTQSDALPGIDDAGEPRTLRALTPVNLPSDGRPHRVPLARFEGAATVERTVSAELAEAVILEATLVHAGAEPILAGPVDLIRDHGLVGRTSVGYVAPGERFPLGFGPDSALRVRREVEDGDVEKKRLSSWRERRRRVGLRLSNLGDQARTVTVRERVPVSEVDKVRINVVTNETTGQRAPDDDGILTWEVELAAHGRADVDLTWELRAHEDVRGLPL